jgi:hypothetical protein
MNTSTHQRLDSIVAELIRRGLPATYAERAAAELADHHRDLVDELQAAGWTDFHAELEASRRLGDPLSLLKKTVREYQRRYWCGRWPLLTFFLGPIPTLLIVWLVSGLLLAGIGWFLAQFLTPPFAANFERIAECAICYSLKTWITLASPLLVMLVFCWLAARAAMSRAWMGCAAGMMALFIGFVPCTFELKTTANSTSRFTIGYNPWFLPENFSWGLVNFFWRDAWQLSQLVLPFVATGCCVWYFRARTRSGTQLLATFS